MAECFLSSWSPYNQCHFSNKFNTCKSVYSGKPVTTVDAASRNGNYGPGVAGRDRLSVNLLITKQQEQYSGAQAMCRESFDVQGSQRGGARIALTGWLPCARAPVDTW